MLHPENLSFANTPDKTIIQKCCPPDANLEYSHTALNSKRSAPKEKSLTSSDEVMENYQGNLLKLYSLDNFFPIHFSTIHIVY